MGICIAIEYCASLCAQGILPNANETAVINMLAEGQFDALVLENTPLSDDFLFPPTPNPEDIGLRPRRQASEFIFFVYCAAKSTLWVL